MYVRIIVDADQIGYSEIQVEGGPFELSGEDALPTLAHLLNTAANRVRDAYGLEGH